MLVYANTLKVQGEDSFSIVTRSIYGWLKEKIGAHLSYREALRYGEWQNEQEMQPAWLRTYVSTDESPAFYAWILKHPDSRVRGRQWLVEIGLRHENESVEISFAIQTDEASVLVKAEVSATRPRLVQYIIDNLPNTDRAKLSLDTPGRAMKVVGRNEDDYRALYAEIDSDHRDFPIVLVSPEVSGRYLVDAKQLQEALVGLAQVVQIIPGFDSFEMERTLGRQFSAWDGAINIIYVANKGGYCRANIILSDEISRWGSLAAERVSKILAIVTHNTNIPRQRNRIRTDGVAQLALKRRLKKRVGAADHNDVQSLKEMNEELFTELDRLSSSNEQLKGNVESEQLAKLVLEEKYSELESEIGRLRYKQRVDNLANIKPEKSDSRLAEVMDLATRADEPTPEECLSLIENVYPDRVKVLPSAYASARDYTLFQSGRRLMGMLNRLATAFVDRMKDGGDNSARGVFSVDEYAATESDSTKSNSVAKQKRTFSYDGREVLMLRHLKIGKADDQRKSIRVYFEWMPEESLIVIGHCGVHLPVISH